MKKYRILISEEFRAEWNREVSYSKKTWSKEHAKDYFSKLRSYYQNQLNEMPWVHVNPNKGMDEGQGYIKFQGHYILFEIIEREKKILLLDLYGRNRFFEIQNLLETTRKKIQMKRPDQDKVE